MNMQKVHMFPYVFSVMFAATLIAVFLISPTAQALNSHAIDLESSSSQFLSIDDASQNGLDLSGAFTLETWVKLETVPQSSMLIMKGRGDDNTRSYSVRFHEDNGSKIMLKLSGDGSSSEDEFASWTPSVDTWYHIAVTYDGSTVRFYLDGSQLGSDQSTSVSSLYNSNRPFRIGASEDSAGGPEGQFDGMIDEVRVWNIARTGTQIADDYNRELNGNETGLVGYWKLNNSLTDSSGNGNTLTNNNSATFSTSAPFTGYTSEMLRVRKTTSESLSNSTVLQKDDQLKLSLAANKSYIIDGVILASSTSATPDLKFGLFGQSGIDIALGYEDDTNGVLLASGESSSQIDVPTNVPISIQLSGTIVTSESGDVVLKWAQNTSNGSAVTVLKGSYLRAVEI